MFPFIQNRFIQNGGRLRSWLVLLTAVVALLSIDAVQAQDVTWHRISHELADGDQIRDFATSPDERYAVYIAGGARKFRDDIYSVPIQGGTPVRLNPPLSGLRQIFAFRISPDSQWVVYIADQDTDEVFELYSVPIDGSTAPVKLNGPMVGRGVVPAVTNNTPTAFAFTPDSQRVLYVADQDSAGVRELYNAPIDGAETPIKLSDVGNSSGLNPARRSFALVSDGSRVIYIADQNLPGVFELFSVPTAGNAAAFRLSGALVAGGDVTSFTISPDDARIVYVADQEAGGVFELFSVPANGGIVSRLNPPLLVGQGVGQVEIIPNGRTVLLVIQDATASTWAAPIDGSTAAFQLANTRTFAVSPDGQFVVYGVNDDADSSHLERFGFNDNSIVALTPSSAGRVSVVKVTPDSQRVLYTARSPEGVTELLSMPMDGSSPLVKVNGDLDGNIFFFDFFASGDRVFFLVSSQGNSSLFQAPVDGSTAPVQINAPLTRVFEGVFSPDGRRILYRSDQLTAGVFELFSAFDSPQVAFTNAGYVVTENGGGADLAVERNGIPDAAASVRVALDDETATGGATLGPGIDYENNALTVNFAGGQVTATVPVPINDDGVAEAVETFAMQLFEPVEAVLSQPDEARVSLKDTDQTPLLSDSTFRVPENTANGALVGKLAVEQAGALTYSFDAGNTLNAFRVEDDSLVVNNSSALDFESRRSFVLTIKGTAADDSFDLATVTVAVSDVNEAPVAKDAVFALQENTTSGTKFGAILASDPDSGDSLTFATGSRVFAVDAPSGTLFVRDSSALDFETNPVQTFIVNVSDAAGLKGAATVTVNLSDVAEPDPNAIRLTSLSPTYAVAGGSSFWLRIYGENFTRSSQVRWNGSPRSTYFSSSGRIYGKLSSTDIAKSGTFLVDVSDGKKISENGLKFPVYIGRVGTHELTFDTPGGAARSVVGQTTTFTLTWTHTTLTWREMDVMDLRVRDDEKTALWLRYTEAFTNSVDASSLTLLNVDGTPAGSGGFGEDKVLENATVAIDLANAGFIGTGVDGASVTVRLPVTFKKEAVGPRYNVELYAVDDQGGEQGPDIAMVWEITDPTLYLPWLNR